MKVSIITICFNNEKDIKATIESVVSQTYSNIEYIIIDGSSTDNTLNVIKKFETDISKVISENDDGIYDAINKGIQNSNGDILGLIHAGDELYDTSVIEKIVHHFKNNKIDALYGHSKIFSENGKKLVRINKSPEYHDKLFSYGWLPSHQSFYAKLNLFKKYGNYNLNYKIAADYELLLRFLLLEKVNVKLLDEYIVKFKLGGASSKSIVNILKQNKECFISWKENGLKIPFYTMGLKLLRKLVQIFSAKIFLR